MKNQIKIVAFDADDTLWINEDYFHETEKEFCFLLKDFLSKEEISRVLFETEMKNLHLYGYGVKGFVLSMIETASTISQNKVSIEVLNRILEIGHYLLERPVELIDGVQAVLDKLHESYRLVIATKGDLLDQERKLEKSGLKKYFNHIEIMSSKKNINYTRLLTYLKCKPDNFLMIGNSVNSDILPVLEVGAFAAHVPYHLTWKHEITDYKLEYDKLIQLKSIKDINLFL